MIYIFNGPNGLLLFFLMGFFLNLYRTAYKKIEECLLKQQFVLANEMNITDNETLDSRVIYMNGSKYK